MFFKKNIIERQKKIITVRLSFKEDFTKKIKKMLKNSTLVVEIFYILLSLVLGN